MGKATIIQYLEMIKDSYILFNIKNIDSKFSDKITNPKYYFYDTGLLNIFLINQSPSLLENLVALYLIQSFGKGSVYFFKNKSYEIDFFLPDQKIAVQVCFSIHNEETKDREIKPLIEFSKFKECNKLFVITLDEEKTIETNNITIKVIPLWKILLDYSTLI